MCSEGARGCRVQWLVSRLEGAPNFSLRRFVLEPGGCTPRHKHPWEHIVYVLRGRGKVVAEGGEQELAAGMAVFLAPDEEHQFLAAEDEGLEFLCAVPNGPATEAYERRRGFARAGEG